MVSFQIATWFNRKLIHLKVSCLSSRSSSRKIPQHKSRICATSLLHIFLRSSGKVLSNSYSTYMKDVSRSDDCIRRLLRLSQHSDALFTSDRHVGAGHRLVRVQGPQHIRDSRFYRRSLDQRVQFPREDGDRRNQGHAKVHWHTRGTANWYFQYNLTILTLATRYRHYSLV